MSLVQYALLSGLALWSLIAGELPLAILMLVLAVNQWAADHQADAAYTHGYYAGRVDLLEEFSRRLDDVDPAASLAPPGPIVTDRAENGADDRR